MIKLSQPLVLLFASFRLCAQNLILNPSCDDSLVNGNIPHWQEIVGTNWSQRCASPNALTGNGSCYFFAGANSIGELSQTIDLTTYSSQIDNGNFVLYFHGYETSYSQSPSDDANIYIQFTNVIDTLLSEIHFGPYNQTSIWAELDSTLQVPALTRMVKIKLRSVRHNGSNNDGYYDELYLGLNPWVGISDLNQPASFSISPNPTSNYITIQTTDNNRITSAYITNMLGEILIKHNNVNISKTIDISKLTKGIYYCTLSSHKFSATQKFVKQ